MDEKTAYLWAARCLKPIEGKCEPHLGQQVADKIVSALIKATKEADGEKAQGEVAQLQTRLVGSQEINASLTHFVLETQAEAVRLQGELDRANGELAAVNASLGEFYIPVRDPETDEPGGAFYQDHGVWIVVEELAAHVRAFHLAAEEMVHLQDEVARLHKVNTALVAAMKMVRDYIARVHGEGLPRGAFGPVQLYQIMDGAVEDAR